MTFIDGWNFFFVLCGLIAGFLMFWDLPVPRSFAHSSFPLPFLSIIIPARNEEKRIEPLLHSLQLQTFQLFEVIVIDDGSTDLTAETAKKYGATVIHSKKKYSGAGKSAACWQGVQIAQGNWLLFLDADTAFMQEDSLKNLLLAYERMDATGILSIQPYHTVFSFYENLSAVFNIVVIAGMNVFTVWKTRFKPAGSFGPCILCTKTEYLQTGGHEKIKDDVMDDVALGQAFMEKGFPVRCLGGKGTIAFRMYSEGFKKLVEGWSKSFALGSAATHRLILFLVILWIAGSFISTSLLISAFFTMNFSFRLFSGTAYLLYAGQMAWFARRCGNFNPLLFLFYPFFFLFFSTVFLYSMYRVHVVRSVQWRGRDIDV